MSDRKNVKGLLGLLVVALIGVMGLTGSAQALTPQFTVNGKSALHASGTGEQEGAGSLVFPAWNFEITCANFEVIEGLVLSGGLAAHIKLLHRECKVFSISPLEEMTACHVSDVGGGNPKLLHVTASALLLPVEFADGKYGILLEKIAAFLNFLSGLGCTLPLKNVLVGEVCFKITAGNDTKELLIQTNQEIQGQCPAVKLEGTGEVKGDNFSYWAKPGYVKSSATLKLLGEHIGLSLGVLLL